MARLGVAVLCVLTFAVTNAEHFTAHEREEILWAHNTMRSQPASPPAANMLKLRWDEFLANKANDWVEQCQNMDDRFVNENSGTWKRLGQNNWEGNIKRFKAFPGMPAFVWARYGQLMYSFAHRWCEGTVSLRDCSEFVQVVMATTEAIGCAKKTCPDNTSDTLYVTCFYGPGGILFYTNPYLKGEPCSACPEGFTCDGKLCVPPTPPSERDLLEDLLVHLQRG